MNRIFLLILSISLASCSLHRFNYSEYNFSDDPYRHMKLVFYKNDSLVLENYHSYAYGFISYGKWEIQNSGIVIIKIDTLSKSSIELIVPTQGDTIDSNRLLTDPNYGVFPLIKIDTCKFSKDKKSVYLKGFEFKLKQGCKDFFRFSK